jgi:Peptidase family M23
MRRLLAVLILAGLIQAPAAAGWSWPVDGPVVRPFVLGDDPYAAGQHRGIDIGAAPGTSVRAATDGSVSFVGTVPAGGKAVTVRTVGGLSVTYLELGATGVERGADVAEGDPIGTIGPAAHVHLGVRVTADAQGYLDPLQFLPARATGPARADPVPESAAAVVEPQADADSGDRAEPPAPQAATKPKAEPEPVVQGSSTSVAAPTIAPVATEPAPAPVGAEPTQAPTPTPATAGRVNAARDPTPAIRYQGEPPPGARLAAPAAARKAPASHRVRRASTAVRSASRATNTQRTPGRIGRSQRRPARAAPEPVLTVSASKGRPIESPRGRGLFAAQSNPDRRVALTPVLALAAVLLGVAVAVAIHRRRRGVAAPPPLAGRCFLGHMRPPRLLHACAQAGEVGWLGAATRPRSAIPLYRPLPRPRRSVPAEPS